MTCCTASSLAAASIAFSGAFFSLGPTLAECASDSQNYFSTSQPSAPCPDKPADVFALLRKSSECDGVSGDGAGLVVSRLTAPLERAASGFGWSTARLWDIGERGGVPVGGRWPYVAITGTPGLGAVSTNSTGRNLDRVSPYRFTKTVAVSNQLPIPTPETPGKVPTAVGGLTSQSKGGSREGFGSNGHSANAESDPGPYAMLVIGLSLAAFMAIRRMGHS